MHKVQFLQLLENYRKTRSVELGKQLLDVYDSCEDKKQLLGNKYLNCVRTLGQIRKQVLGVNLSKELISMIEKFKTEGATELAEKILETYDSLTSHHKMLGDRFHEVKNFVQTLRAQLKQNLKQNLKQDAELLPVNKFFALYEEYKKTRSKEIAEEIVDFYNSTKNKMKTFGTEFDKIHRRVRFLRKKLKINTASNNDVAKQWKVRKLKHLIEKFKQNSKISTAEEIIRIYESMPNHEKIEIKHLVEDLKQELQKPKIAKFIELYKAYKKTKSNSTASEIIKLYKSTQNSEFGMFSHKIKRQVEYLKRKYKIKFNKALSDQGDEPQSPGRTHAVINLSYRLEKFKIRKYLLNIAKQFDTIKVVTLPGTEWIFERDLLIIAKNLKITLIGLENDCAVYNYSKQNMPEHPAIQYLNLSDIEFFSKPKPIDIPALNFIWLDYMGPFTTKRIQVLQKAIENNYLDDICIVAFTFLAGREKSDVLSIYKQYQTDSSKDYKDARTRAVPLLYKNMIENLGFKVEILKSELYKEPIGQVHTAPMLFIALKLYK